MYSVLLTRADNGELRSKWIEVEDAEEIGAALGDDQVSRLLNKGWMVDSGYDTFYCENCENNHYVAAFQPGRSVNTHLLHPSFNQ